MGIAYRTKRRIVKWLGHMLMVFTEYWICYRKQLPVGVDLFEDIKNKLHMNDPKIVLDVGANTGQTTEDFVRAFPMAHIYSFEPVTATYDVLREKTSKFANVTCEKLAFGEREGKQEITLFNQSFSKLNSLNKKAMNDDPNAQHEVVEVTTVDKYALSHNLEYIDLLKVDTEGYEIPALKGAQKLIDKGKVKLVYCEVGFTRVNVRNTYISTLVDYLHDNGFVFFAMYDISHIQLFRKTHYGNILFVHQDYISEKFQEDKK